MRLRDIETVRDHRRAAVLVQHPLRRQILAGAREPVSASELARALDQPRQRLNYHVRQLARAGFLRPAGRRMRRNLEERKYVATARAYVLAPDLLGDVMPSAESAADTLSASYLLALATQAQRELGEVTDAAAEAGVRVLTLAVHAEVRFTSGAERAAFGKALTEAVAGVVAAHGGPARRADGGEARGRPYRLLVGCYPIPQEASE